MVLKRAHNESEIEELAQRFRESWSEGQIIRSWLRTHSAELRELVRDKDWSWANIGRALSAAGIQFKTGKAWTGENVRRAVDLAMKPRKGRMPKAVTAPVTPVPPSVPSWTPAMPPQARPEGEPEFRIIQRGPGASARGQAQLEAGGATSGQSKRGDP